MPSMISSRVGLGVFQEQAVSGEDHPRGAETALQGVVLDESRLERVQVAVPCQAFDGDDVLVVDVRDRKLAGAHGSLLTRTVQAPQKPSPQPNFVPVSLKSVRSTHRSIRSRSTSRSFRLSVQFESDGLFHAALLRHGPAADSGQPQQRDDEQAKDERSG